MKLFNKKFLLIATTLYLTICPIMTNKALDKTTQITENVVNTQKKPIDVEQAKAYILQNRSMKIGNQTLTIKDKPHDTWLNTLLVVDQNNNILFQMNYTWERCPGGREERKKALKALEKWLENYLKSINAEINKQN